MNLPNLDSLIEEIRAYLAGHERLPRVAGYWHGFEGWLKFEIATELERAHQIQPWTRSGSGWTWGDIGVEYRYRQVKSDDRDGNEPTKLIDLWVGNEPTYVELKNAFRNANAGKQLRSWRADFEKLTIVLEGDSKVRGYASILVAVGHNDREWSEAIQALRSDPRFLDCGIVCDAEPERVGLVRLAALRHEVVAE
ncbi:MAG: hypothetical protein KF729_06050 [Sandaracinaceae bacterium]|nr:hypothetical protein [Sandaracinaceae bacterium]